MIVKKVVTIILLLLTFGLIGSLFYVSYMINDNVDSPLSFMDKGEEGGGGLPSILGADDENEEDEATDEEESGYQSTTETDEEEEKGSDGTKKNDLFGSGDNEDTGTKDSLLKGGAEPTPLPTYAPAQAEPTYIPQQTLPQAGIMETSLFFLVLAPVLIFTAFLF